MTVEANKTNKFGPGLATGGRPIGATDKRPEDDTTGLNAAQQALDPQRGAAAAGFIPPRVVLTIDFGTLSADSIAAIGTFVKTALDASPAQALGFAGSRPVTASDTQEHEVAAKTPAKKASGKR